MVTAEIKEATIQKTMVKPRGLKYCPEIPCKNPKGRNTTQVVSVPPKTEAPTTFTESIAASLRLLCRSP